MAKKNTTFTVPTSPVAYRISEFMSKAGFSSGEGGRGSTVFTRPGKLTATERDAILLAIGKAVAEVAEVDAVEPVLPG